MAAKDLSFRVLGISEDAPYATLKDLAERHGVCRSLCSSQGDGSDAATFTFPTNQRREACLREIKSESDAGRLRNIDVDKTFIGLTVLSCPPRPTIESVHDTPQLRGVWANDCGAASVWYTDWAAMLSTLGPIQMAVQLQCGLEICCPVR